MKVNEIFTSVQGEGKFTGYPSVFVRLSACNLCCAFKGGSVCDSMYAAHPSSKSEVTDMTPKELAERISQELDKIGGHYDNSHIVLTGGEPLVQQKAIVELIKCLHAKDIWNDMTIETNGSIVPCEDLLDRESIFFSISPKLSTSCCFEGTDVPETLQENHKKNRINIEALQTFVNRGFYQLKFVYSGADCIQEIQELLEAIEPIEQARLEVSSHVLLMPEGITSEQLGGTDAEAVEACIANGWRYCDRVHIRIWGDKRGV